MPARSLLLPLAALSLVSAFSRTAAAQEAAEAAAAAAPAAPLSQPALDPTFSPPGQTLSCAGCYAPPSYAPPPGTAPPLGYAPIYVYAPPLRLSDDELELLGDGEISTGQHVVGSLLALSPGFGLGHMVQGRWMERGWIFTVGEAASMALFVSGIEGTLVCDSYDPGPPNGDGPYAPSHGCQDDSRSNEWRLAVGIGAYIGLRIWEIADAITAPTDHNRRVRALRSRIRQESGGVVVAPFLAPAREGGAMAGVAARF